MRLILASASPRRRELFALLGLPFEVLVCGIEENPQEPLSPSELVAHLSLAKAKCIKDQLHDQDAAVLGADTVVAIDDLILGKPVDANDARRMLTLLSGREHSVYTGVTLLYAEEHTQVVETRVRFREMTPEMIDAYIATGEPFDKAGAYGIQGFASAFVESIAGDYFNVVGLPVATVAIILERAGVKWWRPNQAGF